MLTVILNFPVSVFPAFPASQPANTDRHKTSANTSAINAVYTLASYTYGPILGMFAFGLACKRKVKDRFVPLVAILAPALCLVLQLNSDRWFGGYKFSYEILLINAVFVILGLCCLIEKEKQGK